MSVRSYITREGYLAPYALRLPPQSLLTMPPTKSTNISLKKAENQLPFLVASGLAPDIEFGVSARPVGLLFPPGRFFNVPPWWLLSTPVEDAAVPLFLDDGSSEGPGRTSSTWSLSSALDTRIRGLLGGDLGAVGSVSISASAACSATGGNVFGGGSRGLPGSGVAARSGVKYPVPVFSPLPFVPFSTTASSSLLAGDSSPFSAWADGLGIVTKGSKLGFDVVVGASPSAFLATLIAESAVAICSTTGATSAILGLSSSPSAPSAIEPREPADKDRSPAGFWLGDDGT